MRTRHDPVDQLTTSEQLSIAGASWHSLERRVRAIGDLKSARHRLTKEDRAELAVAESQVADRLEREGPVTFAGVTYTGEMGAIRRSLPW